MFRCSNTHRELCFGLNKLLIRPIRREKSEREGKQRVEMEYFYIMTGEI